MVRATSNSGRTMMHIINKYSNCSVMNKNNKSGQIGVHWVKTSKKWRAKIVYNNKAFHLGLFENINDAIEVRIKAEIAFRLLKELDIQI